MSRPDIRPGCSFRLLAAGICVLLLTACGGQTSARSPKELPTALAGTLDRWRTRDGVTAAAMAVDVPGRISWSGASGWFDRRGGRRVQPADPFRIASVTKLFVATVIMQLVDEQKISLDDPVKRHVPDAPHSDGVRIRHLLQHSSGIPDAQDARWARDALKHADRPWSREKLLGVARNKSRQFEPGSRFGYSNTNYLLLGDVMEAATGTDWGTQVRTRIIEPLGLSNTFVSEDELGPGQVVAGYVDSDRDGATDDLFRGPWRAFEDPAGGMVSSAPDLIRFARALFEGDLLSKNSLMQMAAPRFFSPSTGYGLGVQFSRPDLVTTVAGHTGGMPGFSAALMYLPESRIAIAALANDGSSSAFDLGELAMGEVRSRLPASIATLFRDGHRDDEPVYGIRKLATTLPLADPSKSKPRRSPADPARPRFVAESPLHIFPSRSTRMDSGKAVA